MSVQACPHGGPALCQGVEILEGVADSFDVHCKEWREGGREGGKG
jgi:hypothetical protein